MIIAIDGYSSTGKSSFAKKIAERLSYKYVDTGALYRAVTYFAYTNGFIDNSNTINKESLKSILPIIKIGFKQTGKNGDFETYLNNKNIDKQIRSMEVSNRVSYISTIGFVRDYVNDILHKTGKDKGVVMDGRDIGTIVFPNAELKIFMTASPEVRAQRRFQEIKEAGGKESLETVLKNIKERDFIDENRKIAPLKRAADAYILDNSNMSIPEQFLWLNDILINKYNISLK